MLLKEWMTKNVVSVTSQTSLMEALDLLKKHGFRRLPVVDENSRPVGIITDRDMKAAAPSKATNLDEHELNYLLSSIKIGNIMTKNPITLYEEDTIQAASSIMLEKKFAGLPIVDENGILIGIITESDLFRALLEITGGNRGNLQILLLLNQKTQKIQEVIDIFSSLDAQIVSVLATPLKNGLFHLYVRSFVPKDLSKERELKARLSAGREMLYWIKDKIL